jgi:hypothetical protein
MKIIRLDAGFRFDDKNSRWGNPSYQLDPGDPGYIPPLADTTPKTKTKKMKRQAYYPSRTADQILWLENFRNKLAGYLTALGLTTAQGDAAIADARWLLYVLGSWLPAVRAWGKACTDATTEAQSGGGASPQVLTVFTAPTPATGVVPVATGALDRIFDFVQTIKESSGYTEAIGTDLGTVGAEQGAPDLATVQPILTATINGSRVDLGWGWGGNGNFLDMLEIQVDRSDGKGFVVLVFDTTPDYTDSTPFPATATKWTYRAIYRVNDAQVGQWSAPVSVTVGG